MALDRYYRALMLLAMVVELLLLGWLVYLEARNTKPFIYGREIESVRPDPPSPGRYVQFGMGPLILDTRTGQVCDSYPQGSQLPGGYAPCRFGEEGKK